MLRYQPDAFIQVTEVSAVVSRAVFAAYIVGTVAKAAADASATARLMTGRRHHLHLRGEQGCELHKVSRQANPTPSLKIKRAGVFSLHPLKREVQRRRNHIPSNVKTAYPRVTTMPIFYRIINPLLSCLL